MTLKLGCLLVLFSFCSHMHLSYAQDGKKVGHSFQELQIRGGFPYVRNKIKSEDSICIAYFGGSITNQEGWRVKSYHWFVESFPEVTFKHVNASIGGTNSEFGAFRLKEHVLKFNPDLVFVEFAVNDGGMSDERILQSMEGIVRQIWHHQIQCDICFVYTLRASMLDQIIAGEMPHTVSAMEKIAGYYNIPSIWFSPEVIRRLAKDELIMKGSEESIDGIPVFSSDGVHPYLETGHEIYTEVFKRSMPALLKESTYKGRELGAPFNDYNLEEAFMVDPAEIELKGSWETANSNGYVERFFSFMPGMVRTSRSKDKAIVKFRGTEIGCFDIMGPGAGRVAVIIDGVPRDIMYRFDKHCTYYRMNSFQITGLDDTTHTATFEFIGEPFDKERILKEMHDTIPDPESYLEYSWYLGKILLLGELQH